MNKCFVIMPFSGNIDSYYEKIYAKSIQESGLAPLRADEYFGARPIMSDVVKSIYESSIILADLTDRNANVNYELGIAHALGKPTIMIAQKKEDIPFDYQHIRIYFYDTTEVDWQEKLSKYILKSIEAIKLKPSEFALFDSEIIKEHKKALSVIRSSFTRQKAKFQLSYNCTIDTFGNCNMEISSKIKCISNLSLIKWRAFISEPGEILIKEAIDYYNGKKVDYLVYSEDSTSKDVYFILENKEPEMQFKFVIKAYLDNYTKELVQNGIIDIHHNNTSKQNLNIEYTYGRIVYKFPNTEMFSKMKGDISLRYSKEFKEAIPLEKIQKDEFISFSYTPKDSEKIYGTKLSFRLRD